MIQVQSCGLRLSFSCRAASVLKALCSIHARQWPQSTRLLQTWCLTSTETMRLIRDGEKGVWRWGKREIIYLSLHCRHQNDSCIKMDSDESHFNISVGSDGRKVMRQCPQTTTFLKGKESRSGIELRSFRLPT